MITKTTSYKIIKGIKKDDTVKVIAGKFKGETGKVAKASHKSGTVTIEGLGVVTRHLKPSQVNPRGGTREVHVPIDISKVVKVEADTKKATSAKQAAKPKKETK